MNERNENFNGTPKNPYRYDEYKQNYQSSQLYSPEGAGFDRSAKSAFVNAKNVKKAENALVFGILSLCFSLIVYFFCVVGTVFGILALVNASRALSSPLDIESTKKAKAGKVLGIIGLCISGVETAIVIIRISTFIAFLSMIFGFLF